MTHAIRRIQDDIRTLHTAQATHQADAKTLRSAGKAEDTTKAQLTHDRDVFASQSKALTKDRASVTALQGQIDALDPASPDLPALQAKLATQQASTDALAQQVATRRTAIHTDLGSFNTEKAAVKQDTKKTAAATTHVKADFKRALKDLRPAEYKMGLKQTNATRKELGLSKVKQTIRPNVPNVVGGQVGSWIAQAQTILKQHGVPLSKMNAHDLNIIIQHESSGNPNAINRWDSNAAAGHPSEGLMQTIGPTFNSYKLPGHGSILNPVDNIIAGARYAIARYGSISNVPGVIDVHQGRAYVGY